MVRPPVGSRGPPPSSPYHGPLMRPILVSLSYVVFMQRIRVFPAENGGFTGFSACAAMVYFGTIAVSPAGLFRPEMQWPRECLEHPRGRIRKLLWSSRTMASVADAAPPVGASPSPVRHGVARLTLRIGGTDYRLRPMPAPPGFRAVWVLRKLDPCGEVTYSVAAPKGQPAGCTCPDHEHNGATCKHIMALAALGLIPRPKAARPKATSPARARQLHAKNARQAIAEAKALPVEARRHLAEIAPAAQALPEGWQPGGAHPSFATGFRTAVQAHVARIGRGGYEICDGCGREFDVQISGDPNFCESCVAEGGDA
jgi:hypothetical protein